ncbi:RNA methyltransferase [uncultured Desulfovibrio sp.]|uniref:TrmH family RNA methyltransferase n=1 Tax=uncultured Desulfovibrio sp. TaxID=167968 RepID=UPI0025D7C0FF|nr:RNA methyltransferase [uncultured Desulfovibrio sp.]
MTLPHEPPAPLAGEESPEDAAPPRPVTPRRRARLFQVLSQRQPDLTLVLANIHDPHNVSAIYRSCDAFGVSRVHLYYTDTPFPALGRKSSASARKWVESERHRDKEALFAALRDQGMQVLATSCSPEARPLREWDFLRPTAVILGNEHEGVDEALLARADGRLYIPMHGMIQSLNVSVAAAVILAEAARQREAAGYYAAPRMGAEELDATLADWLQR